jgi:S-adenosylmethionine hydrolase
LLKEYLPTDFAHPAGSIKEFRLLQPMTMQGNIRGTVVYIDNYGNCISNISRKMVEDHFGDRKVSVNSNVGLASGISKNYSDVEEGEIVCLYNSSGFLEIAINRAQAEKLLGIKIDTPVMIMPE